MLLIAVCPFCQRNRFSGSTQYCQITDAGTLSALMSVIELSLRSRSVRLVSPLSTLMSVIELTSRWRSLRLVSRQPRLSYNTTDAARACGVTAKTITHWCEAGKHFPNARKTSPGKGGRWIVPASDIEAFLKRRVA